jgi:alpha-mannosidase
MNLMVKSFNRFYNNLLSWSLMSLIFPLQVAAQEVKGNVPLSPIKVPAMPSNLLPGKKAPVVTDIWVVFKTHCDLGYTMPAEAVFKKYRENMMDNAIRLIENEKQKPVEERFRWTIAGWPMKGVILGPLQIPERRKKVEQALRDGAISVHALPATMESDVMEQEDYVRSLIFSSQIARDYGHPLPIAAKMTDVPAHSWLLPTLLHNAGIKFLQIGCNYTVQPMRLPQLFWWEGPDGSKVLCNYTPHYGSGVTPPENWPSKNYLAVIMTHDNEGPPSPKEIENVKKQVAAMKGVRLHLTDLDEYAKVLLKENPEVPTIRGDMVDPWIHGVMAMPQESKTARNVRPMAPALDIFNTQIKNWGITTASLQEPLAKAYENSMLFSEHTFGAWAPGTGIFSIDGKTEVPIEKRYLYDDAFVKARKEGLYEKFEASFKDKARYINITDSIITSNFSERMKLLAENTKAKAGDIIVYNPLPWLRSGMVEINGKKIVAENIPANGYKVIAQPKLAQINAADKNITALNTTFYTVKFDTEKGGIASLIEKNTGKELVDQQSSYVLGQFLHERFSYDQTKDYHDRNYTRNNPLAGLKPNMPKDISYLATTPTDWVMNIEQSAVGMMVTLTSIHASPAAQAVSISFTFPKAFAYVDVEWNVKNKTPNTVPDGGWLCFPFKVDKPKYILGRLGGAMDLAKDQIVGGNRYLYAVQSGASVVAPDQSGVGLCAIDAPLMSFGEPGLWKYDYDYFPKQPTVFVNLYNNMWNTNFPYWTEGSWTEKVRIWNIQPGVKTAENLAVKSWEARLPLIAITASGKGTKLPSQQSGVSVSRKGILVTAFGDDPDGNKGTLIRLWEEAGNSGMVSIALPAGKQFHKATPINLRGAVNGKSINIVQGKFSCPIKAFGPASFILQ